MTRWRRQPVRIGARPWVWPAMLIASSLLPLAQGASAKSAEATFSVEVPAHEWKGARVKNIPRGATLSLELETDGAVAVLLLDAADYGRFPEPVRPVFRGKTEDRLSVSVLAPVSGHYYVLIDNREGSASRSVELTVRGETADADPEEADPAEADTEAQLRRFQENLNRIFTFEPFPIRVKRCGVAQAFSGSSGVVLCREYASKLYERLRDREKASDALLFTLFHEVGHVLLDQWNHPMHDNEEAADEFATAVLVMVGQGERVRAKVEFFQANPSLLEALVKAFQDDRHPLSQQRARNISRWLDDPSLVRRWQTVFVPHMQTAVLERLRETPTAWADVALVEKELTARR